MSTCSLLYFDLKTDTADSALCHFHSLKRKKMLFFCHSSRKGKSRLVAGKETQTLHIGPQWLLPRVEVKGRIYLISGGNMPY